MQALFDKLFARYGMEIWLGDKQTTGFFFSVNSRSWQNMEQMYGPLGSISRGQYICILPVSMAPKAGDILTVAQRFYRIRRAENVFVRGNVVYRWCLCVQKGGDDTW